ncbi:MAG: integrase, partial [Hyphomonadaceae bacterium]|nr:integrase [Hyphomonadaceae bacterium]
IMSYFDAHQDGLSLSGPASKRGKQSLETAAAELSPLPGAIADRARLRTLLKDLARTLHVGPLADCFFDPAHALCLKRATDVERDTPAMALCEPTRCPNPVSPPAIARFGPKRVMTRPACSRRSVSHQRSGRSSRLMSPAIASL